MRLAIFDLDETLIAADSGSLFCEYLTREGLVGQEFVARDKKFMDEYAKGEMDIHRYIHFFVSAIKHLSVKEIDSLTPRFVEDYIVPVIYPQAYDTIQQLKRSGCKVLIISATSEFIVRAISIRLGIEDFLAINLAKNEEYYTGQIQGVPSFREGKITRLINWLASKPYTLENAEFYSDSINDLPLLRLVDTPVATNPDKPLLEIAQAHGWKVLLWDKPQYPNQTYDY